MKQGNIVEVSLATQQPPWSHPLVAISLLIWMNHFNFGVRIKSLSQNIRYRSISPSYFYFYTCEKSHNDKTLRTLLRVQYPRKTAKGDTSIIFTEYISCLDSFRLTSLCYNVTVVIKRYVLMSPAFRGWIYLSCKCDSKQSRNVYMFRSLLAAVSWLCNNTYRSSMCYWKVAVKGKKFIILLKDLLASLLTQWVHLPFHQGEC